MIEQTRKVTVLVPSYNHGQFIRERILSVLNQTYSNIELIIIDDCSTDNSHEIISELQAIYGFKYLRNKSNSRTPFSAWEQICEQASGDYIWVCESDDVADPKFLEIAIAAIRQVSGAVMFYCSSQIIDEFGRGIGHSDNYFHDIWKDNRWDRDFVADGLTELVQFQLRGQTLPNMSSALFDADAFKLAFTPFLKRLRLTGDWLFVGEVMRYGRIVFCHETLNQFRKHDTTCRMRVRSRRSQAEFIITRYRLFRVSDQPISNLATLMVSDVVRFLSEPVGWRAVVSELLKISIVSTIQCGGALFISVCMNFSHVKGFIKRYRLIKKTETI